MRVLFCKFHCPFVCFCKSPLPLFSPCPLKLEDVQNVSSSVSTLPDSLGKLSDEKVVEVDNHKLNGEVEILPKSSLKKQPASISKGVGLKGRVQWMDLLGKELVEIKEFEPSESGDSEDERDGNRGCICVIQ